MSVKEITSAEEIPSGMVVLDFFATWCGPCKRIAPAYEALAAEFPSIVFMKVDVDEATDLAEKFGVNAMPTFVLLHDQKVVSRIEGADIKSIQSNINYYFFSNKHSTADLCR